MSEGKRQMSDAELWLYQAADCYRKGETGKAFELFLKSAHAGNLNAMNNVSACYANGIGIARDETKAFEWMKLAADQGLKSAEASLAKMYCWGIGTETDYELAVEYAERALEAFPDNADLLSTRNTAQEKLDREYADAEARYNEAAGCVEAQEYDRAFELYLELAKEGWTSAMANLAGMYGEGIGTDPDPEQALYWLEQAAEGGDAFACRQLAVSYFTGEGALRDDEKAMHWIRTAMELDPENEEYRNIFQGMGTDLLNEGMEHIGREEYEEAYHCFLYSAETGEPAAMNNLSVMYADGSYVNRDPDQAFAWLKKAAEAGFADAFSGLAIDYFLGEGTGRSLEQCVYWAGKALEADPENEGKRKAYEYYRTLSTMNADELFSVGTDQYERGNYPDAFALFSYAADMGHAVAMNNISSMYDDGLYVRKDEKKAFEWMKKAAEAGFSFSCMTLAEKYENGYGTAEDHTQAVRWAQQAVRLDPQNEVLRNRFEAIRGSSAAYAQQLSEKGMEAVNRNDFETAYRCFSEAADLGAPDAMNNLSVMYANGHYVQKDPAQAFEWMKKAAETGYVPSFSPLSSKYYSGSGTERNLEQAVFWAQKACEADPGNIHYKELLNYFNVLRTYTPEQFIETGLNAYGSGQKEDAAVLFAYAADAGNPNAMNNLSVMYAKGEGVVQDDVQAFEWMKKAAENGSPVSCRFLAYKYENGSGTAWSYEKALEWAEKSVQLNPADQESQTYLAQLRNAGNDPEYLNRRGLGAAEANDFAEAFRCFHKAAQLGSAAAMNNLSAMYDNGHGVPKDDVQGFEWCRRAAEAGFPNACYVLANKYEIGRGTQRNREKAVEWAQKAVNLDPQNTEYRNLLNALRPVVSGVRIIRTPEPEARLVSGADPALVELDLQEGIRLYNAKQFEEALVYLERAGKAGHYKALRYIAVMYARGEGVIQNGNHAVRFFEAAAYRGDPVSWENLRHWNGRTASVWKMYAWLQGKENTQDYPDEVGFDASCVQVSEAYRKGYRRHYNGQRRISGPDDPVGIGAMVDARDSGHPDALCDCGEGQEDNILLKEAALLGSTWAMVKLAEYYSGKNLKVLRKLYQEAADRGNQKALQYMQRQNY
ncbi:MAG: sel1 repeat family protein [Solobacterium sp.]|nr:sel1 repeat family protein [Solobacterium sp.]